VFLFFSSSILAKESLSDWHWGGFLTQGLSLTDSNNFAGRSSEGVSTDFREFAVHATWRATNQLHLAGQVMSRKFGTVDDGKLQFDYLLADLNLSSSVSREYGVRVGRVKLPYGFYNETRDVAFTRPSIALPQSIYFNTTRELQLSADGMGIYADFPVADMRLDIDLLIGMPRGGVNTEYGYFREDLSGRFDDDLGMLSRLALVDGAGEWLVGITLGRFGLLYLPGPLGELGLGEGDVSIDVAVLGGQYNTESVSMTAEYMLLSVDRSDLGGVFEENGKNTSQSYYLQVEYRFANDWDLMLRYDVFYLNKNDRKGLDAATRSTRPAYAQWSKDYTRGVGWRASPNITLRAEWHNIQGTGWLAVQDNLGTGVLEKDWNLYLLQASYRF
jgi:hypothetical protein